MAGKLDADNRSVPVDHAAPLLENQFAGEPVRASTVTALMTGFGETVRTLGLFEGWDFDERVAHYGKIVQVQIDACAAAPA
jgi:hypothetical protein